MVRRRRRVAFGGLGQDHAVRREAAVDVPRHFRGRSMDSGVDATRDTASAGDWSRPDTPSGASQDADDSRSDDEEPVVCADLAAERALVRHSIHPFIALVRRQLQRLEEAEDADELALSPASSRPAGRTRARALTLARLPIWHVLGHADHPLLVQALVALAPVLALLCAVLLSAVIALLGALAAPWQPPPPPQSCFARLLAAFLPAWSSHDDPPLVRPF